MWCSKDGAQCHSAKGGRNQSCGGGGVGEWDAATVTRGLLRFALPAHSPHQTMGRSLGPPPAYHTSAGHQGFAARSPPTRHQSDRATEQRGCQRAEGQSLKRTHRPAAQRRQPPVHCHPGSVHCSPTAIHATTMPLQRLLDHGVNVSFACACGPALVQGSAAISVSQAPALRSWACTDARVEALEQVL